MCIFLSLYIIYILYTLYICNVYLLEVELYTRHLSENTQHAPVLRQPLPLDPLREMSFRQDISALRHLILDFILNRVQAFKF